MRRFYLQNVESIHEDTKKGTCPSGQIPFIIVRVMITLQQLPARRLTETDYQHITANLGNIWETTNFLFRLKEKTDGFLRCKFRFKFRCSYMYNKVL